MRAGGSRDPSAGLRNQRSQVRILSGALSNARLRPLDTDQAGGRLSHLCPTGPPPRSDRVPNARKGYPPHADTTIRHRSAEASRGAILSGRCRRRTWRSCAGLSRRPQHGVCGRRRRSTGIRRSNAAQGCPKSSLRVHRGARAGDQRYSGCASALRGRPSPSWGRGRRAKPSAAHRRGRRDPLIASAIRSSDSVLALPRWRHAQCLVHQAGYPAQA